MIGTVLDTKRFPVMVGISEGSRGKIVLEVDAPKITEGEWPVPGGVIDGTPKVDDLEPMLQELRYVLRGEMTMNACGRRCSSLVNMHLGYRLAFLRAVIYLSRTAATDSYDMSQDTAYA